MKLDKKIVDALNYRIQQEELSYRIYEQMALWLDNKGFKNFAKKYYKDAKDELKHSGWAKDHLLAYGIEPELLNLSAPALEYDSLKEILMLTLEHEQEITRQCNELAKLTQKMEQYPSFTLAMKFCEEQVEELDTAQTLVDQITTFGDSKEAMITLEHNIKDSLK
jgi:ferritin